MPTKINVVGLSLIEWIRTRRDFLLDNNELAESARAWVLATLDENRRAVGMLNPMPDTTKVRTRGEKGRHL